MSNQDSPYTSSTAAKSPRVVPPIPSPAPPGRSVLFTSLLGFLTLCGTLVTFGAMFGRYGWAMELASNFRVQYFVAAMALTLLAAINRRWLFTAAGAMLALVNAAQFAGVYVPEFRMHSNETRTFRILSANVFLDNRKYDSIIELVERERPDFFMAMEVDRAWAKELNRQLADEYPHSQSLPNNGTFGIAFFTKHPVKRLTIENLDNQDIPVVIVELEVEGQPLTIIGAHTTSPRYNAQIRQRNAQLRALTKLVNDRGGPILLVGDLNVSPWSHAFGELLEQANLRDSRRGFGIQPTWPAHLWPLLTPIDHCLVTEHFAIKNRRVGHFIGSDHYPIVVDFSIGKR